MPSRKTHTSQQSAGAGWCNFSRKVHCIEELGGALEAVPNTSADEAPLVTRGNLCRAACTRSRRNGSKCFVARYDLRNGRGMPAHSCCNFSLGVRTRLCESKDDETNFVRSICCWHTWLESGNLRLHLCLQLRPPGYLVDVSGGS